MDATSWRVRTRTTECGGCPDRVHLIDEWNRVGSTTLQHCNTLVSRVGCLESDSDGRLVERAVGVAVPFGSTTTTTSIWQSSQMRFRSVPEYAHRLNTDQCGVRTDGDDEDAQLGRQTQRDGRDTRLTTTFRYAHSTIESVLVWLVLYISFHAFNALIHKHNSEFLFNFVHSQMNI